MLQLKNSIKGNFLQYVRSYSFLITIAASIYVAFSFVPSESANYSTMRYGDFVGAYNSSWIGFVTAIMSSVFLSLFGFFLINGSLKKDIDTRIGQIVGATRISNAAYIFTKIWSNFIILLVILSMVLIVSIGLFFLYGKGFDFNILDFIQPYLFIAIPSLLLIVSLSIILEIFFPKKVFVQYGIFLLVFFFTLFSSSETENNNVTDLFGIQQPLKLVEQQIIQQYPKSDTKLTIGLVSGGRDTYKVVEIKTPSFSKQYLLYRLFWMFALLVLVYIASFFFHRFNLKEKQRIVEDKTTTNTSTNASFDIKKTTESITKTTKLTPLIRTELTVFLRKNPKWVWFLTVCGMAMMGILHLDIAHGIILPIAWFLQIAVWSDIATKDKAYRTHYFVNSSYKPVQRLFVSRIIAGVILALTIALPLLLRLLFALDFIAFANVILGALFIVLLAIFLGVITKGKKLFEILFFFLVYSNLNKISITDYFGSTHNTLNHTGLMLIFVTILFFMSYFLKKRNYE